MDVKAVAQELAGKVDSITGLTAFHYAVDKPPLPCAVVVPPDEVDYDQTYGRGSDAMTIPLYVFVPRTNEKAAAEAIYAYLSGSGSKSVKAKVDNTTSNTYVACDTVTITRAVTGSSTYNGVDVYYAEFTIEISGAGA